MGRSSMYSNKSSSDPSTNDHDRPKEVTRPGTRGTNTRSLFKTDRATKANAGRGRLLYESLSILTCTISSVERSIIDLYHIMIGCMLLRLPNTYKEILARIRSEEGCALDMSYFKTFSEIRRDVSISKHTRPGTECDHQSCFLSFDRTL
jgi:hypothetical protein